MNYLCLILHDLNTMLDYLLYLNLINAPQIVIGVDHHGGGEHCVAAGNLSTSAKKVIE